MLTNKKRLIQNLLLLLIIGGLVFFISTREENKGKQYQTLYDNSFGDEVTEITIHQEGRDDVVIQNKGKTWSVVKPTEFTADIEKVQLLFTLLSENAESSYDIKGKDLASYGLDKDRLSIRFNTTKLVFGNYNQVTQQRYILKGEIMYLVAETISPIMRLGADGFKPLKTSSE